MNRVEHEQLNREMIRLADGDRAAFRPVFDMAWPNVRRFAEKMLKDPIEAEDAAQTALLKIFGQASSYKRELDALPWILTLTAYECKTLLARKVRRREELGFDVSAFESSKDSSPSAEDKLIERDLRIALAEVLESLNPTEKETIFTILEERERPNIPSSTFRKRLQRVLKKMEKKWRTHHADKS